MLEKELVRFIEKVELVLHPTMGSCWQWTGFIRKGYGRWGSNTYNTRMAHRIAYQHFIGSIPETLTIDHLCRNRACVNPAHLEAVTNKENTLRGTSFAAHFAAQTHCLRGHPFDADNTQMERGERRCKICRREREKQRVRRRSG